MAKVVTFPRPRPCPICNKPAGPKHHPFCSDRCREVDLNRWLGGQYAIPAVENDEEDSGPSQGD
ncbi:DNA gyrase inhibitor YacG [Aestuariivirga litoralis]|uniref:DNA gyrase inhibitor YacG n=1 Tax=Aestuariivirga litoralis TaxID=2650924 RepID=UPI0018C78419|nr:DNA gyrase inhibitor YacG [Aestuariivirga litoralis]